MITSLPQIVWNQNETELMRSVPIVNQFDTSCLYLSESLADVSVNDVCCQVYHCDLFCPFLMLQAENKALVLAGTTFSVVGDDIKILPCPACTYWQTLWLTIAASLLYFCLLMNCYYFNEHCPWHVWCMPASCVIHGFVRGQHSVMSNVINFEQCYGHKVICCEWFLAREFSPAFAKGFFQRLLRDTTFQVAYLENKLIGPWLQGEETLAIKLLKHFWLFCCSCFSGLQQLKLIRENNWKNCPWSRFD